MLTHHPEESLKSLGASGQSIHEILDWAAKDPGRITVLAEELAQIEAETFENRKMAINRVENSDEEETLETDEL